MVNGINFNPFTGKALTPEEIAILDSVKNNGNGDGKVSFDELKNNINLLGNYSDEEGLVNFDELSDSSAFLEVSTKTKDAAVLNSGFRKDYKSGKTNFNATPNELFADLKSNLQKFSAELLKQLKSESGVSFNQDEIQKILDKTLNKTINDVFAALKNKKNDLAEGCLLGSGFYNIASVIDKFVSNFNELSKSSKNKNNDSSQYLSIDKNDMLASNPELMNRYYSQNNIFSYDRIKETLSMSVAGAKQTLIQSRPDLTTEEVERIISESAAEISNLNYTELVMKYNDLTAIIDDFLDIVNLKAGVPDNNKVEITDNKIKQQDSAQKQKYIFDKNDVLASNPELMNRYHSQNNILSYNRIKETLSMTTDTTKQALIKNRPDLTTEEVERIISESAAEISNLSYTELVKSYPDLTAIIDDFLEIVSLKTSSY